MRSNKSRKGFMGEFGKLERKRMAEARAQKTKQAKVLKNRWAKLQDKITYPEECTDYYKNSPIQPGFMFFNHILTSTRVPCSSLTVRIPEGIFVLYKVLYVSFSNGVRASTEFTPLEFYSRVEKEVDLHCAVYLRIPKT
ncbi:MAG: hypothetical protein V2I33_22530 [Kangiellaceae bacterium]|nr:hypothetical protein [Kangiellaceae bacterium]